MAGLDPVRVLSELVRVRSVNDPVRGERPPREAAETVASLVREAGLEPEVIEVNGFYSVMGELGDGEPVVMLMAHFDTVGVVEEEWTRPPFQLTVEGQRAYGRGSNDDKGNVAAMITALSRLASCNLEGTLVYAFTGDEEIGGVNGAAAIREILRKRGKYPKYLVNGDGGGLAVINKRRNPFTATVEVAAEPRTCTARAYRMEFNIDVKLRETRHAAYFMPGVDTHPLISASLYARLNQHVSVVNLHGTWVKSNVLPSRVTVTFADERDAVGEVMVDDGLTRLLRAVLPITRIPIATNMTSEYGVTVTPNFYVKGEESHKLTFDIRAMVDDIGVVKDSLRMVLDEYLEDYRLEVRGGRGLLYTPRDAWIVQVALKTLEELGLPPRTIEMGGASDSRHFSTYGVECIDFGLIGGNTHGPDEYVEIPSLYTAADFYFRVVRNLFRDRA